MTPRHTAEKKGVEAYGGEAGEGLMDVKKFKTGKMKKKYYRLDNGDTPIIDANPKVLMDIIESEASDYQHEERYDEDSHPNWVVDLIWLTDEEFQKLDDA